MNKPTPTPGEIAFRAYVEHRIQAENMDAWRFQSEESRGAWEAAANAVINAYSAAGAGAIPTVVGPESVAALTNEVIESLRKAGFKER